MRSIPPVERSSYLRDLANRTPVLEREQELLLTRRFRDSGDPRAADELARAHLREVISLATKHRHYGVRVAELIAEGNCGLVDALRRFDPERGVRLGTYARHWILAYILAYVVRSSSMLGGSSGLVRARLFFRLRRERARITTILGTGDAADEALAKRLQVTPQRLRVLIGRLDCREVSLDLPRQPGPSLPVVEALSSADDPEASYFQGERDAIVRAAVSAALLDLDPRERFIVEHRLLAAPTEELSLAQIARSMGVSAERARQLEQRAKHKLRRSKAIRGNSQLSDWFADSSC